MAIETLHDLMVHELRDLYSAERQLVQALPKMAKNATSPELEEAITTHLEQTREQVNRLEQIFETLGVSSRGTKCKGMEGLLEEGKALMEEDIDGEVLDAGLIAAAQRVEHYEIAGYGTVLEFARVMGHDDVVSLLEATLEEEKETDQLLTSLAEGGINALAERDNEGETEEEGTEAEAVEESGGDDSESASAGGSKARTTRRR